MAGIGPGMRTKKIGFCVSQQRSRVPTGRSTVWSMSATSCMLSGSLPSAAPAVYEAVIAKLAPGDVFVIWDLDPRLSVCQDALVELDKLHSRGIEILIPISTSIRPRRTVLLYTFISGLAEFERRLCRSARVKGWRQRPKRSAWADRQALDGQIRRAAQQLEAHPERLADIAAKHGVHPWTLSRAVKRHRDETNPKDNSKTEV